MLPDFLGLSGVDAKQPSARICPVCADSREFVVGCPCMLLDALQCARQLLHSGNWLLAAARYVAPEHPSASRAVEAC
jgi:hypothetical protein